MAKPTDSVLVSMAAITLTLGLELAPGLAARPRCPAEQQAGSVNAMIPKDVLERGGRELTVQLNDAVNWNDLIRTLDQGRVRIALLDGSMIHVGVRSIFRVIKHDVQSQQTQIELTLGRLRAHIVKLAKPTATFVVRTQTAATGAVGTEFVVDAEVDTTRVYCIDGSTLVRNIDPGVPGEVVLRGGQMTTVRRGFPPTSPIPVPASDLQAQVDQTSVTGPDALQAGPGGQPGGPTTPGTPTAGGTPTGPGAAPTPASGGVTAAPSGKAPTVAKAGKKAGSNKPLWIGLGAAGAAGAIGGLALRKSAKDCGPVPCCFPDIFDPAYEQKAAQYCEDLTAYNECLGGGGGCSYGP